MHVLVLLYNNSVSFMPFVVFKFIILALNSIKVFGVGHISYLWQVLLSCGKLYVGSYLEILNYLYCCF